MSLQLIPIKTALISVSDKTNLVEFAQFLQKNHVKILSTGGTAATLRNHDIPVTDVSDHTGFPEMMDGRVKTLHPKIHGGLLALNNNPKHQEAQKQHGIDNIDLVIVNLYPFEETIAKGADYDTAIENIDIGGPAMLRSAAKNHSRVTVITDITDYTALTDEMTTHSGSTSVAFRQKFAAKTYARTANYDSTIAAWFNNQLDITTPDYVTFSGTKQQTLRYGENPHQQACFYATHTATHSFGVATATQHQGKELSYNNFNDTDAAFELVSEFDVKIPTCVIVKHANPCGVAHGSSLKDAYLKAFACDTVSAFGGIIAFNQTLDADTAQEIVKIFTEVIIAPNATDEAKAIIATKKNLRLLTTNGLANTLIQGRMVKNITGGLLVQSKDIGHITANDLKIVTNRHPTDKEVSDLLFAFTIAKHVKSNAIIYTKNQATVGIGAGQMSRLDSSRIAARKALDASQNLNLPQSLAVGSVVASDAFFPFADGLISAAEAGVTAIIQPGGSMRDQEVIDAANERNLAMVFTGMRHFRH
ncbi:MAG: phosphoribosylaminoimidazolecarboxamide formyltransferase/IMP cyclohydrolase [Alphaproteobacteria bacterium]